MKRTTLLAVALATAVVLAVVRPALANRDPGFAGMPIYGGLAAPMPPRIGHTGPGNQYADGMNLYQYAKSSPMVNSDWNGCQASRPGGDDDKAFESPSGKGGYDIDLNLSLLEYYLLNDRKNEEFSHKFPCSKSGFTLNSVAKFRERLVFKEITKGGCDDAIEYLKKVTNAWKEAGWKPDETRVDNSLLHLDGTTSKIEASIGQLWSMQFKQMVQDGNNVGIKRDCPDGYECCEVDTPQNKELTLRLKFRINYHDLWGTSKCSIDAIITAAVNLTGKSGMCMPKK